MSRRWLAPRIVTSAGWWRLFLAAAALCLAVPIVQLALGSPGGTGWWTAGYGLAATALLAACLAYAMRRRMPRRGPWASHHWLRMHVYGGTLFLILLFVHAGARLPAGPLAWGLWAASLWVVGTGLLGVFIQKWIPPVLTSALATEVHYERIPELVAVVREKVDQLVAVSDDSVRRFHQAHLAPALAGPRTSFIYFFDVTGGIQSRMRQFDYLGRLLDADDSQRLEELRTLMRTKLEMDAHYTLQKALRWWLYLHAPPAFLLAVLVPIHVFAVFYY